MLIVGIHLTTPGMGAAIAWVAMNLIMAIDMFILGSKRQKLIETQSTKKCPRCAESIKSEAKVCRFCNAEIEE